MKTKVEKIIMWMVILIVICATIFIFYSFKTKADTIIANEEPLRFQKIKSFTFQGGWNSKTGIIYCDTETNIKYLYVYRAGENGAAMTRLWE